MKPFLYFLALVGLSQVATAYEKLVPYDPAASVITLDRTGQLEIFRVRLVTEFTVKGVQATLDKLRPGMKLNISLSDPQTASCIAVIAAQPLKSNGRTVVIKMRVVGSEMVLIKGGSKYSSSRTSGMPGPLIYRGPVATRKPTQERTSMKFTSRGRVGPETSRVWNTITTDLHGALRSLRRSGPAVAG